MLYQKATDIWSECSEKLKAPACLAVLRIDEQMRCLVCYSDCVWGKKMGCRMLRVRRGRLID